MNVVIIVGIILCVLILCALILHLSGKIVYRKYSKQAHYINVNNAALHIHCTGDDSHLPVVLEAGAGDCYLTWNLVQTNLTRFNKVLSYDRAGLGVSTSIKQKRQLLQYAKELHLLLSQTTIKGPVILVGHSFGGLIVLYHALLYPEKVAGIVLVDSAHEKQFAYSKNLTKRYMRLVKLMLSLSWFGSLKILSSIMIRNKNFSPEVLKRYRYLQSTRKSSKTLLNELNECATEISCFLEKSHPVLQNMPLVVITRGKANNSTDNNFDEMQKELQKKFLSLSNKSKQIIAKNSGHFIQWTELEVRH